MRQPVRQHRQSREWLVSSGLTILFVAGSLWYLDFLPSVDSLSETWTAITDRDSQSEEDRGLAETLTEGQTPQFTDADQESMSAPAQWEPDVTTAHPHRAALPVTPASFSTPPPPPTGVTIPASTGEQVDQSPFFQPASSESERIAKIFEQSEKQNSQSRPFPEENSALLVKDSAVIPASSESPTDVLLKQDSAFAQIDQWIAHGEYLKAHRDLSQKYWKEEGDLEPLLTRLNKTAGVIYFAPQPHFMQPYEVQVGDLLQKVAPQYNLSWEYLARLNRVRPERVKVGQKLKLIKGPFSAFVDLSDFSLTVHAHGYFVKRYAIGIGKENSTPIGTFSVKTKLKNPTYYGPDGVIDADDANNPLGERWIDIGDSYGIHGTIDPNSIGKAQSRGCLRLSNEEVVEVYDFLTTGSEVVIRP